MKSKKIVLTILLTNLFIAFLGIGLVIPVLPTIMNELEISGSSRRVYGRRICDYTTHLLTDCRQVGR